jgi:3'-phosphoadenosine 5'-phosphosulfate synthase
LDFSRYSLSHHLLHSSLSGPEKLEHYSLSISQDKRELRGELRLGSKVCGHPAFIHGGAIASVCDDAMGMLFLSSGHGSGFTANLNVNYRKPIPAGTNLAVVCSVDRVEVGGKSGAKKVFLSARIEGGGEGGSLAPTLFAEATSLFVVKNGVKGMWNWGGGDFLVTLKGFLGF